jgi:NAD(P)-dependent dehydrogenase (short-subunit alcohol dehydrogenase family)
MELEGRVALVTGAGSGIGAAAAVRMARAGARVALVGRTGKELEQVARKIRDAGGEARVAVADISVADEIRRATDETAAAWGRLDVVFANAGINGVWAPLEELAPEEWDRTLATNLRGTFLTVKYAVPHLKKQGGAIVVTSSINGTRVFSNTGASAYATSKAGQVAFTKMIALELAKHRVRANVICPGAIETEIEESTEKRDLEREEEPAEYPAGEVPLTDGRPGSAEQVAELVLFLASDASSHITGTEVWIDGAQSLLIG